MIAISRLSPHLCSEASSSRPASVFVIKNIECDLMEGGSRNGGRSVSYRQSPTFDFLHLRLKHHPSHAVFTTMVLNQSRGSAYAEFGRTRVIVSV